MNLNKKGINFLVVLIVSVLVLSSIVSAITGSMGNARMILYPEVDGKNTVTIDKSILTRNTNNVSINVTLVPDDTAKEYIEMVDKSFILQPTEEKNAKFIIRVKNEGTYQGKINVFFKPIEGKEPGVVLSSTVIVIAKKDQGSSGVDNTDTTNTANTDNTGDESIITREVTGAKESKKLNPAIFLIGTTLILLIVLVFLILLISRKKSRGRK